MNGDGAPVDWERILPVTGYLQRLYEDRSFFLECFCWEADTLYVPNAWPVADTAQTLNTAVA